MKRKELNSGHAEYAFKIFKNRVPSRVVNEIVALGKVLFKTPTSRAYVQRGVESKPNLITIVAYKDGKACAYKIGYEQSARRFYSWLGGVHPDHRGKGLARELMKRQHELARAAGYKTAVTHTRNEFREMLLLNIRSGFAITGTKQDLGERELTIVMEKKLN